MHVLHVDPYIDSPHVTTHTRQPKKREREKTPNIVKPGKKTRQKPKNYATLSKLSHFFTFIFVSRVHRSE